MKKIITAIFLVFGGMTFAQDLPPAQQIFDKYIEARGGKEAIAALQDFTISLTSETPRGVSETEIKFLAPDKMAMSVYANGMEIMSSVYDGTTFQRKAGFMGRGEPIPPKTGEEAKREAFIGHPFAELYYTDLGAETTVAGIEKVNDKEAYKVIVKIGDRTITDFYEVASGLKVKTMATNKTPMGEFESTTLYENYKAFKGSTVLFAATRRQSGGRMGEIVSEIGSIKFNKGLKDKDFEIK